MSTSTKLTVNKEQAGERLDQWLASVPPLSEFSRAKTKRLIDQGLITLNKKPAKPGSRLKANDRITITLPAKQPAGLIPRKMALDILFEDKQLIAINKPAGLVVHPGAGNRDHTLVHGLLHHCKDLSTLCGPTRPGIVHRLDKQTTGVILVAKNDSSHQHLSEQFKNRTIDKVYEATVFGVVTKERGRVQARIGRHPVSRQRMSSKLEFGRDAETHFSVLERFSRLTHLRLTPKTGRTHQLRVHMADIGHPIVGDTLYGGSIKKRSLPETLKQAMLNIKRQALHARLISFTHPTSDKRLSLEAPLPEDMLELLQQLRQIES